MRYSTNVDKLLSYGEFSYGTWPNYLELGFTLEDVPALLQLIKDEEQLWDEEEPARSAFYHAWRTLGQLKAEAAIFPLLQSLADDDWSSEETPKIFGLIGEKAIFPLKDYLFNPQIDDDLKGTIITAFEEIVKNCPALKEQCIAIVCEYLPQITEYQSSLAGCIVSALMDWAAKDKIDIIREAFQHDYVDISVVGDIEEVEIEFGFRSKRATPRPIAPKIQALREMFTQKLGTNFDEPETVVQSSKKVGRNDPCPCGSGKKYKKCCLN